MQNASPLNVMLVKNGGLFAVDLNTNVVMYFREPPNQILFD